jgi:phage tail sheath protein FI
VVANDLTAAQSTSVFHYQSNVRVANAASKYLRMALIPFLGRPNTQETLTAMATAVRGVLNRLAEIGALLGGEGIGYRFSLEPTASGLQTIEVRCVAELRPANFIRAITVDLTVTL